MLGKALQPHLKLSNLPGTRDLPPLQHLLFAAPLKANSSFKKCGEQEYPAVAVLGRVIYSVAEQRRRGIPALPGEASASPRNKQEMLQHWNGRNRAPGQGCSSRIALKQPKEPALCIKEYAGNFTSALLVQVHLRVGDK